MITPTVPPLVIAMIRERLKEADAQLDSYNRQIADWNSEIINTTKLRDDWQRGRDELATFLAAHPGE